MLPALSWAVAQIVAAGLLRDGIMILGLAPCEISSVATTAGEAALAAGALIGSTVLTVAAAGPILALEAGRAAVHPGHIISSLALIVAQPQDLPAQARRPSMTAQPAIPSATAPSSHQTPNRVLAASPANTASAR